MNHTYIKYILDEWITKWDDNTFRLSVELAPLLNTCDDMTGIMNNYEAAEILEEAGVVNDSLNIEQDHEMGCCYYSFGDIHSAHAFVKRVNDFINITVNEAGLEFTQYEGD